MILKKIFYFFLVCSSCYAADFTVSSYNCGGLLDHYDYIRAVSMQRPMQRRHNEESAAMAQLERIQACALKILFASPEDAAAAEREWSQNNYDALLSHLITSAEEENSPNEKWFKKANQIVTPYNIRPIIIHDQEIKQRLLDHAKDITRGQEIILDEESSLNEWLAITRSVMAKRLFKEQLTYDIIALQEADYLDASLFPDHYEVRFSDTGHSINGVAWNKERFDLVQCIGNIKNRGFVVLLRDKQVGKTLAFASAHLTGCNPFRRVDNDSAKGDRQLAHLLEVLASLDADMQIIAMDSNVTATHPRLSLLKEAHYQIDYENYVGPTCTNPHQLLNTRIDWIAVHSSDPTLTIRNIPVLGIGLNSPQTNISDHKPIAGRVSFQT